MAIKFIIIRLPNLPNLRNTRPIMAAAGGELARYLREYFRGRGGTFWPGIAEATALTEVTDTTATVSFSPPEGYHLLHKINGGTVTAKAPRKYLAIPANSVAKKAGWPSHWSTRGDGKLKVLFGKNGPYALALKQNLLKWGKRGSPTATRAALAKGKKGNYGRGVIMYWLKHSVYHRPDPEALPDKRNMARSVIAKAEEAIARRLK